MGQDNGEEGHIPAIDWIHAEPEYYPDDSDDEASDLIQFDEPELPFALPDTNLPEIIIDGSDAIVPMDNTFTLKFDQRIPFVVDGDDEVKSFEVEKMWDSGEDDRDITMTCEHMMLPASMTAHVKVHEVMQTTQGPDESESSLDTEDQDSDCDSHGYLIPKVVQQPVFPTNAMEYVETHENPENMNLQVYDEDDYDSEGVLIPKLVLANASQAIDPDQESSSDDDDQNSITVKLVTATIGVFRDPATIGNEGNGGTQNGSSSVIPQLIHFLYPPASPDKLRDNDTGETGEQPLLNNDFNDHAFDSSPPCLNFIPIMLIPPVQDRESDDSSVYEGDNEDGENYFTA